MAYGKIIYSTLREADDSGWRSQWNFEVRFDPCWWVVGLHFFPGWRFTICLGPIGLELVKSRVHI